MADQIKYTAKLKDKRILIIGGSSGNLPPPPRKSVRCFQVLELTYPLLGIGYAVAEACLEHGAQVIISSSSASRISTAVQSLQHSYPSCAHRITGHPCDMSASSSIDQNISALLSHCGKLDHMIYTAGDSVPPTPIAEATVEKIRDAGSVRYEAAVLVAKYATRFLNPEPGSSITLTTGVVTERPIPGWSVIAGARAAVLGLSKALALDLRPIRVNTVCVGAVDTETWSHLSTEEREKTFKHLVGKTTTGRIARPEDVAEAYVYCMKDANVTGSVIHSNGGALLM